MKWITIFSSIFVVCYFYYFSIFSIENRDLKWRFVQREVLRNNKFDLYVRVCSENKKEYEIFHVYLRNNNRNYYIGSGILSPNETSEYLFDLTEAISFIESTINEDSYIVVRSNNNFVLLNGYRINISK